MAPTVNEVLRSIYYDTSSPGSFATARKLYNEAKKKTSEVKYSDVEDWLKGEFTYTLHKPARKRFRRNQILVQDIDEQWEADLVDLQEFSRQNNGNKYLITIIDSLSKYAWALPIKNKTAKEVTSAFSKLFESRRPEVLRTDKGKEFVNSSMKNLLDSYNIKFYVAKNEDIKCAMVERFNRTLKAKMFKYFTAKGTRKYIDVVKKLVSSYNSTVHRITKHKPSEINEDNRCEVFKNIYGYDSVRDYLKAKLGIVPKLAIGDTVRIKYQTGPFDKSFYPNWSDRVYKIISIEKLKNRELMEIEDEDGIILDKKFYPEELQKVKESLMRIEKVIKRRTRQGKIEYFVKWVGYPSRFNQWIPKEDLINV